MKTYLQPNSGRSQRHGQGLIEFALVAPMLLMILIGILEAGWLIRNTLMVSNGAREGARAASLAKTTSDVQLRIQNSVKPLSVSGSGGSTTLRYSMNGGVDNFSYTLLDNGTQNNAPVGSFIQVVVVTKHRSLTALFPFLTRDVRFAVTMRRETT